MQNANDDFLADVASLAKRNRPLFDAGLLHAAVVSRRPPAAGKSIKNQNSFDQLYGMVKPADFSMLAPGLGIGQKQPDQ